MFVMVPLASTRVQVYIVLKYVQSNDETSRARLLMNGKKTVPAASTFVRDMYIYLCAASIFNHLRQTGKMLNTTQHTSRSA